MTETWSNWAGDQHCAPERVARPESEDEVAALVRETAERGQRMRVVGAGHSFTDIACTDGVMVDLGAMNRILDADAETGLVRMQAGASVNAIGAELEERGLALENQGDIDRQAIAGALCTATHGTGIRFGNISSRVERVRLIDSAGQAHELSAESDPDALRAARVSLGALGVITEISIRAVPLFTIRRVDTKLPVSELLSSLDERVDSNDHFEIFVFPYADVGLARTSERTDDPPDPPSTFTTWLQEGVLENSTLNLLSKTGRARHRMVPRLNRLITSLAPKHAVKVDRSWRVYASRREVRFNEMEYAIPRNAAREAVERVLAMIDRRSLPVNFPLEIRWAAGDDAFLSTANGRQTCYIAVHQFTGMEFESYFRGVEAIMNDYDGRPHWGKRHYQTAATLAERYADWDRFQAVRRRLDPNGLLANDYVDRVLG